MAEIRQIKTEYTSVPLYSQPDESSQILRYIAGGEFVIVYSAYDSKWNNVTYSGTNGYLQRIYLVGEVEAAIEWDDPNLLVNGGVQSEGETAHLAWNPATETGGSAVSYSVYANNQLIYGPTMETSVFQDGSITSEFNSLTEIVVVASAEGAAEQRSNSVYFQYKKSGSIIQYFHNGKYTGCYVFYRTRGRWKQCQIFFRHNEQWNKI